MLVNPPAEIAGLYRYPVKGLTPEPLQQAPLRVGQTLPADRRYAIENGPSGFDPAQPAWKVKTFNLKLKRNARQAARKARLHDAPNQLTISRGGEVVARGDLETSEGRAAIEAFFAASFPEELRGPPKILSGGGHSFSDVARKVVSIINLASLKEIEAMVGASPCILCASAPISTSRIGLPGMRLASSEQRCASAPPG
jgi:hypothetical protein